MKKIPMLLLFTLSLLAVPACSTWHRTSSGRVWSHPSSVRCRRACPTPIAESPEIRSFNTSTTAKRIRHRIRLWLDDMTINADDPDCTIGDKNFAALKEYLQGESVAVWLLTATADELSDAIKDLGIGIHQACPAHRDASERTKCYPFREGG